jgi:DNA polymerase III epsilon subunit family exonuclease
VQAGTWRQLVDDNPDIEKLTFVAFDTETTGRGPLDRVVEIAGVKFRGDRIVDEIALLIDPGTPIPASVSAIHGITDDMVWGEWSAGEALREFFRFAAGAIWIAHNAPFDAGVIAAELFRIGVLPPEEPILDTLRQSRRTLTVSSHSLENLVRELDLPPENHHRALPDARHVFRLFGHICRRLGPEGSPTLEQILAVNGREILLGEYLPEDPDLPERYLPLREAALSESAVVILYEPSEGSPGYRKITPKCFYMRKEVLYMEAFCHSTESRRCYRLDRVRGFRSPAP